MKLLLNKTASAPKMSLAKMAASADGPFTKSFKSSLGAAAGPALIGTVALAGAGLRNARKKAKGFDAMTEHAGDHFHSMSKEDKARAQKYYHAIHAHSPTVAGDPIAAWNLVQGLVASPTAYNVGLVDSLRKIEQMKPSLFGKK